MRSEQGMRWLVLPALVLLPVVAAAQQPGGMPGTPSGATSPTAAPAPATPPGRPLSLTDALQRALDESPDVRTARAQVQQAEAESRSAFSNALPQLNTTLAYQRTLRSVFQNVGFTLPDSMQFKPDSLAALPERVSYLERKTGNAAFEALGGLFSNLPFGRRNTWTAGLTVMQPIFTGGRVSSGISMAGNAADAARYTLDETRSDIVLQVKTGYFDAQLAGRSVEIMEQSVVLAQQHLKEVKLRFDAGRASELDTLRAAVDLANLLPALVQARNGREVAVLNLKRLLRLPPEVPLELTTELGPRTAAGTPVVAVRLPSATSAVPELQARGALRAAAKAVDIRRAQVTIARAAFLPTIALQGTLNRIAYPNSMSFPRGGDWRDDWNVALAVSWPLFQGFKRTASLDAANAQVKQAQVQLEQARDGIRIQYQQALGEFERTKVQIDAAVRTSAQAQKVYDLTELRYTEGLATQLDVSSARLALQQARINEMQAYHDSYAALARAERTLGVDPERTTLP